MNNHSNNGSNAGSKARWRGSFNYTLTEAEKKAVKKLGDEPKLVWARLHELTDLGYKVSFQEDSRGRYKMATAYAFPAEHDNAGWSMSMFHQDVVVCLNALWFVIVEVFDRGVWPDEKQLDMRFDW